MPLRFISVSKPQVQQTVHLPRQCVVVNQSFSWVLHLGFQLQVNHQLHSTGAGHNYSKRFVEDVKAWQKHVYE